MRVMVWKNLSTTAAKLAGAAFAAALMLGSLALPNAARAGEDLPPLGVFCGTSGVAFVAGLCDATAVPGSPNTFSYTFNGGGLGGTGFIPLLDPDAIVAGSFMINGVSETPDIITGAAVATDWGSPESFLAGKAEFDSPVALIDIVLPGDLDYTDVTFDSFDAIVTGPILVDSNGGGGTFADPPLPGAPVPEPGSLALLGSALAAIGLYRQRRKRS